jgi:hypothetical protein
MSMENRISDKLSGFLLHTIFQGLGERFKCVEEHVIPTRVEDVETRSA